jgi:translation initiation factor IF-2
MSELKLPRLLAAAKEFNVGQDTLTDALVKRGFNKDGLTATTKLTEDMYRALQAEFQGDKQAKNKADQVEIPKGQQSERKRRDEEEISFRKDVVKPAPVVVAPKEEPVVEAPKVVAPPPPPVVEIAPPPPVVVEVPKVEVVPPVVVVVVAPVEETKTAVPDDISEIVRIEAPELEGPKILGTVDLSAIDNSTRPKKVVKKKEEPVSAPAPIVEKVIPKVTPVVETPKAIAVPVPVVKAPVQEVVVAPVAPVVIEDSAPIIENIEVEKLTGPKILGKIELPVDSDTRPKPLSAEERKIRNVYLSITDA